MPSQRACHPARSAWRLALAIALLLVPSWTTCADELCPTDRQLGLRVAFRTNSTGHPQLNARIEHPRVSATWELDVALEMRHCSSSGSLRKIVALTLSGPPMKKTVPLDYTLLPGLGYFRRPEKAMAWEAARDLCTTEGAALAMPNTLAEMEALRAKFSFNVLNTSAMQYAWVGATDVAHEGNWMTVTGIPLDHATLIEHPSRNTSDGRGENCLLFDKDTMSLFDWACTKKLAFYCKVEL